MNVNESGIKTRTELTEHNKACDMKRNNSMTERMNKNEPPKYWRNPFKGGKNAIKSPARYKMEVWLKATNEYGCEHPPQTKVGLLDYANYICGRRCWDPISDVSFHFFVHNVYSFHIFIRFPSPCSFCSVFKKSRNNAVFRRLIRREQFPCTRLLSLVIIPISLYLSSFLFFNTFDS